MALGRQSEDQTEIAFGTQGRMRGTLEMVESLDTKTLRPRVTPPVRHLASAPVQRSVHCSAEPDIGIGPSEPCPWSGKWNEMSGRAGPCGRMTNGSLALLGSGFWEQGQPTEPFIHLPGSDWAIGAGVRESRGR